MKTNVIKSDTVYFRNNNKPNWQTKKLQKLAIAFVGKRRMLLEMKTKSTRAENKKSSKKSKNSNNKHEPVVS